MIGEGFPPMTSVTMGPLHGVDRVALVTLNRPEQRNALSVAALDELIGVLRELALQGEQRAVVLAGAGPDFCAGADLEDLSTTVAGPAPEEYGRTFDRAFSAVAAHPVPVIGRVQGAALGAGCQLAMACDLVVAADDARLGIPSARLGIVLSYEGIQRVVFALGSKRAAEILFTGRTIAAAEAGAWGLVNRVVPREGLDEAVRQIATAVAGAAPLSVRGSKRGIMAVMDNIGGGSDGEGGPGPEFEAIFAEALESDDLREGIDAFRQRRAPRFKGT